MHQSFSQSNLKIIGSLLNHYLLIVEVVELILIAVILMYIQKNEVHNIRYNKAHQQISQTHKPSILYFHNRISGTENLSFSNDNFVGNNLLSKNYNKSQHMKCNRHRILMQDIHRHYSRGNTSPHILYIGQSDHNLRMLHHSGCMHSHEYRNLESIEQTVGYRIDAVVVYQGIRRDANKTITVSQVIQQAISLDLQTAAISTDVVSCSTLQTFTLVINNAIWIQILLKSSIHFVYQLQVFSNIDWRQYTCLSLERISLIA